MTTTFLESNIAFIFKLFSNKKIKNKEAYAVAVALASVVVLVSVPVPLVVSVVPVEVVVPIVVSVSVVVVPVLVSVDVDVSELSSVAALVDSDEDGIVDKDEKCEGAAQYDPRCTKTDPNKKDTDGNGWWDGIDAQLKSRQSY